MRDSKKNRFIGLLSGLAIVTATLFTAQSANLPGTKNVVVFREAGRYGGWPANHGIWVWGNEIVVGFEAGYFLHSENRHSINWDKPASHMLARSLDGGETWSLEKPPSLRAPDGLKQANVPTEPGGKQVTDCPGGIDFTAPGFAMTVRMGDIHMGPSRFYYTYDKGKTWSGPYRVPTFGQKGIAARTDYLVNGKHDLTMFLTAAKANEKQGHVICVRTKDGGKTWNMISFLGPEPAEDDKSIMPSSARLSPTTIVTALRHPSWIDLCRTDDDGKNWRFVTKAIPDTGAHNGNPPSMVHLRDGRLVITYGYRSEPFGIRARISKDEGATWGNEIILRADGGTWDLGYTRTVQRADGKLVTVYYYNDTPETERYIGATIWDPNQASAR